MRHLALGLAAALTLAACTSGSSPSHYRLPDSQFALPAQHPTAVLAVKLNDSLENSGLVYQRSTTQIHFARQHQWAEALAPAIAKSLANQLNRQPGGHRYTVDRGNTALPVLTVHIEAFQGQYNGHTRIAGYTIWSDARQGRNFDVETAQYGDGYDAMVQSLGAGLHSVAAQIDR